MTDESINYSFKRFVFSRIKSEKKGITTHTFVGICLHCNCALMYSLFYLFTESISSGMQSE